MRIVFVPDDVIEQLPRIEVLFQGCRRQMPHYYNTDLHTDQHTLYDVGSTHSLNQDRDKAKGRRPVYVLGGRRQQRRKQNVPSSDESNYLTW